MSNKLADEARRNEPSLQPPDLDFFKAHLAEKNAALLDRYNELMASFGRVPETVLDEVTQGKVADLNKMLRNLGSDLENQRKLEKAPWDQVASTVHAFFVNLTEKISKARGTLAERQEAYTKRKADEERAKLEEEAKRRKAEADAALAAAAEAEKKRIEAEQKQKEAEEKERAAQAERDAAIKRAEAAEREAREAKQREADAAAAALEKQAEAAKKGEDATDEVTAETDEARKARIAAEAAAAQAKTVAAQTAQKVNEAKAEVAQHSTVVKQATREEKSNLTQAMRSEDRAAKVEEKVDAGDAELGRVRSEHGTVATVQKRWTYRIIEHDKLDASVLWPLVSQDAKEAAVSRYVSQGGRKLRGVSIFEETVGVAR